MIGVFRMNANVKKGAIAATTAIAIISVAMLGNASAAGRKHSSPPVAPPPPSWGYWGIPPIDLDYAQAQALSLAHPYYSHFIYDYCDYRNCTLRRNSDGSWAPVWYGPPS
jgi:hypothetical protein